MAADEAAERICVIVAYSAEAGAVEETTVWLACGATALAAMRLSGVLQRHPEIDPAATPIGVWGKRCAPDAVLRDRDRLEIYRPLRVDPMEARRLRQQKQRAVAKTR